MSASQACKVGQCGKQEISVHFSLEISIVEKHNLVMHSSQGTQRYSLSDFCTVFLHPWASFTHHDGHHTRVWPPRTKHQLLRLRIAVRSGNCCSVRDRGCDDGRNLPSDQSNTYTKSLSTISLCNMDLEPNNHALQLREIWGALFFGHPLYIKAKRQTKNQQTRKKNTKRDMRTNDCAARKLRE